MLDYTGNVLVMRDQEEAAVEIAQRFVCAAVRSVADHGMFFAAVPGGSGPRRVFEILSTPDYSGLLPWTRTHIFFTDERCVPPDHVDSNYRQADEMLFRNVALPRAHIHRFRGEVDPVEAAEAYEHELIGILGDIPAMDFVILGMGADTHTASLFPGSPAVCEESRYAVANYIEKLASHRLTLTYAVFNQAREVLIAALGGEKAAAVAEVLSTDPDPVVRPVQGIRPAHGRLIWVLDRESGARLACAE